MSTDLILERIVPLPPAAIWRAWTEPELLKRWFCPLPWQTVEAQIELRPGGAFRTVLQGPDGERATHTGCYLEVDAPHRLVWTTALAPGYGPATDTSGVPTFTCILTFKATDGGTRYTARAIHRDAEGARVHAAMGFDEGWGAALDQLVTQAQAQEQEQAQVQAGMKGHLAES